MTFPLNPEIGQCFRGWFWNGCAWVPALPSGCCHHCGCSPCRCGSCQHCGCDPCQCHGGGDIDRAPVITGPAAPSCPNPGTLWFDGTTLWIYTGSMWDALAVAGSQGGGGGGTNPGTQPPPNPTTGTLWFDGTTLWVWNGTSWMAVGPGDGGQISNPNIYSVTSFTTQGSFTFTIPNDVTTLTTFKFHLQAGGGGGGGTPLGGGFSAQGGGGGEYMEFALVGAQKGLLVSCMIGAGGLGGGAALGSQGGNGGNTQVIIANTNTTIVANGGMGGWGGGASGNNNSTEGLGGKNGVFSPGTSNVMLVLDIPGGDAQLTSPSAWNDSGGNSFMGQGGPTMDTGTGWAVDSTGPRGYGAGGRGGFNDGDAGQAGNAGVMIIERING